MHALGFFHEQSRPDRDSYVNINLQNVKTGKEHNFNKKKTADVTTLGHKYDYVSVMHYSKTAFSKNGRATVTAKGNANKVLGGGVSNTEGMSVIDAAQLNVLYCKNIPAPVVARRRVPSRRRRRRRWWGDQSTRGKIFTKKNDAEKQVKVMVEEVIKELEKDEEETGMQETGMDDEQEADFEEMEDSFFN